MIKPPAHTSSDSTRPVPPTGPGAPVTLNGKSATPPGEALDRVTRLAARALRAPAAFVTLRTDADGRIRSAYGPAASIAPDWRLAGSDEISRRIAASDGPVVVADAAADGDLPQVGAYIGIPLTAGSGRVIGALCVVDFVPRAWDASDIAILTDLAAGAAVELGNCEDSDHYRALYEFNPFPMWVFDRDTLQFLSVNESAVQRYGYSREEFLARTILDIRPQEDVAAVQAELARGIPPGRQERTRRHQLRNGDVIQVELMTHDIDFNGRPARFVLAHDVTLHRRSDHRYRQLVEAAHEGVWTVDAVGATTYANDRLCEMLGYSASELHGRPLFDFLEPESAFETRTLFARRQRGIAEVQEIALRRRDGTTFMALASASPLNEDGGFVGALMLLTDITERRRVEDALRESQALLAAAEELAHTGSWAVDIDSQEVVWSDEMYRIVGLARGANRITRRDFLERVHPADRATLEREFARLVRTGDGDSLQIRINRPDGETRILQARGRVHRNSGGRVTRVLGSVQDVTERVATLAEVERARRQLATVINDAPLAIATVDAQAQVTSWNPAAERLFGWTAGEVIGRRIPIVPEVRAAEFEEILENRLSSEGAQKIETQRQRKDGTLIDVEIATAPVRNSAGAVIGGMGFIIDVTQRKHLEDQLRQAQKIEAVGQLAGGIAHDFNNIITAIKLHSEFLLESFDGQDARREDVEEIRKAAIRAAGLTRQLLAFSRKQLLSPVVLDLNDTVRELQKMVIRLIGEDIAIDAELAPDLRHVLADAGQIEQVLINLAVNARDAMPTGGRISIRTENVELTGEYSDLHPVVATGRYVLLAVSDTGCGMTREVQSRLFEPFFTTKGPRAGTGLGLSTVYGIVKQSNGYISVRSAPGDGSEFIIYLPAAECEAREHPERMLLPSSVGGSEVVLLVEDEEGVRGLARRILAGQGYVVLEATDGQDALNVSARHEGVIDIVVTDAVMPEMGGLELIRAMRALRPGTRALLMSGYTDDEMTRRGILTPELRFLPKPFNVQELLVQVRSVLDAPLPASR